MGFLLQPRLREGSVGSYPAFSTLPRTGFGSNRQRSFESLVSPKVVRGGIFSVILSVIRSLCPEFPRFREACCLLVSGLSSGTRSVVPATACHTRMYNT